MHRKIWIPRIGEPDVLEVRDFEPQPPAPNEVQIATRFVGVNFADIAARMGLYPDCPPLPAVVGYEVSGIVTDVGEGVMDVAVGDAVAALTRFGGYATMVNVPTSQVFPLSGEADLRGAAAIPVQWLTAWLMLVKLGNVQSGDRVLVHSLGGGVGLAALQICQWRNAIVFGTASKGKHERLYAMGANHCIDYQNHDFEEEVMRITHGEGVDIALDAVGGPSFRKSYRCLAPMGRLFMFGASSTSSGRKTRSLIQAARVLLQMPSWRTLTLINENKGVFGINLGHLWDQTPALRIMVDDITDLVERGVFAPVIDEVFAFDDAAAAHRHIQERRNFGKVLLEVDP